MGDPDVETVAIRARVTDSTPSTRDVTSTYTVDNRYGGRETYVFNGGFENWTNPLSTPASWELFTEAIGADASSEAGWLPSNMTITRSRPPRAPRTSSMATTRSA